MAKVGFAVPILPGKQDLATKYGFRRPAPGKRCSSIPPRPGTFFPPFVDFDQPVPANETVWDWTRDSA
jgi:hypothetical protein